MRNPFPGIDPFIESPAYWPDFHARFIAYGCDALAERLPPDYEARIDERVSIVETVGDERWRMRPDIAVSRSMSSARPTWAAVPAGVATLEPITASYELGEEIRETRIQILHHPDRNLVTVIELLSPENKRGAGKAQYEAKRMALLSQPVHLVELDFLLAGQRPSMRQPLPRGHYYALIGHHAERPECRVYAWTVREPCPSIPIPLGEPDAPVWLDLGALVDEVYGRGRYRRWIDHTASLDAPWSPDEPAWIKEQVAAAKPSDSTEM